MDWWKDGIMMEREGGRRAGVEIWEEREGGEMREWVDRWEREGGWKDESKREGGWSRGQVKIWGRGRVEGWDEREGEGRERN